MNGCPLCSPAKKTHWYETELSFAWSFDCETCGVPMYAHRAHVPDFTGLEKDTIVEEARRMFGEGAVIRWEMKKIQDHAHCHIDLEGRER